jgi:DUF917 family protein
MTRLVPILMAAASVCAAACASSEVQSQRQSPPIRTLSEQEAMDMMVGSSIQSTRASDSAGMMQAAKKLLSEGRKFTMVAADDLPDDWTVIQAAGGIGGGGAWEWVTERTKSQDLPTIPDASLRGIEALSKHIGKPIDALIRNESAGATLSVFQNASALNLPVVDACPAGGRAKPEVQQSLTFFAGLSITPAALVSRWGDTVIIDKTADDYRYEDLARALAVASGGGISNARGVISGRDVKRVTLKGALTEAILFGRTVREAREQGRDPIDALVSVCSDCTRLFQGTVVKAETKGDRGHTYTDAYLQGTGLWAGHSYRVWVKNENIIAWLDGKPDAISPDFIYNLDPKTGDAITSRDLGGYPLGVEVAFVGRKAPAAWRSPKGIESIGPRRYGFDFDYVPLEEIQKTRPKFATN